MPKIKGIKPDNKDMIDEYVKGYEGVRREWLMAFTEFMQKNYPDIEAKISYKMPMYKFNDCYIAFSVAKDHFTFHTLDFDMIEELHKLLPKSKFGKGCAKISFSNKDAIPVLFECCHRIIKKHSK